MPKIFPFCFAAIASLTSAYAQSVSWDEAIQSVEQKGFAYYEYALSRGSGHPGSAIHGLDAERHRCAIVGRILGFRDEIAEAEYMADPPMTEASDPMELMMHAVTLDAWVASARYITGLEEKAQINLWNLECVGNFGIPLTAFLSDLGASAGFTRKGTTLYVYADIEVGFSTALANALKESDGVTEVALGSAGGSVVEAIRAGRTIRSHRLNTVLVGPCYSACPLVFAGGERRIIWSSTIPKIGLHQISRDGEAVAYDDPIYAQVAAYLSEMGVRSEMVLTWMLLARPDDIYEPQIDQLCLPKLATWVQRVCGF